MLGTKQVAIPPGCVRGIWKGRETVFAANRLLVGLKQSKAEVAAFEVAASALTLSFPMLALQNVIAPLRVGIFGVSPAADMERLAAALVADARVAFAEPDFVNTIALTPNDTRIGEQWALDTVRAREAWDRETGSSGRVMLGVVDSGISLDDGGNLDHADLNDRARYILGSNWVARHGHGNTDPQGRVRDLLGHGTHVAGIAAAQTDNGEGVAGLNWRSIVFVTAGFDRDGHGLDSDVCAALVEAAMYANDNDLKGVINFSGAGPESQSKRMACSFIDGHRCVLCAAVGNEGADVKYPAAFSLEFDTVIAVGSTNNDDTVSGFSNRGAALTVVAPGSGILSTTPTYAVAIDVPRNYGSLSGTSMATPLVAGVASLIWSREPNLRGADVRQRLIDTAVKLGAGNFDPSWGYGRVDAARALGG